ncbi:hypothetical protein YC2023_083328 [Brassica napus]
MATKRNFKAFSVAAASSPMNGCKSRKLTEKILKEAYAQQKEVEDEENAPMSALFKQPLYELEDVIDDVDEIQSQLDYHEDMACSEKEAKLLLDAFFHKDGASIAKRVCNAITSSLEEKHSAATGAAFVSITDYYRKLGEFMSLYTNGKMPKALNHLTRLENWESLLKLTRPESWSPNAMYKATNMFASSTKAERFYELFLLPRCRLGMFGGDGVSWHKKVKCSLYLRPTYVAILEKKYALAHLAIDAVAAHFLRFCKETKVMPVIWHQTLLAFVQRKEDKKSLTSLLEKQNHELITPEIVRELVSSRNRGEMVDNSHSASTINNKPIKEVWFDMPQNWLPFSTNDEGPENVRFSLLPRMPGVRTTIAKKQDMMFLEAGISSKIMKVALDQQKEIADEENAERNSITAVFCVASALNAEEENRVI